MLSRNSHFCLVDVFMQENPRNKCPKILSFLRSTNSPGAPCGAGHRRQQAWWWPEQKSCDECVWDTWFLVYLSGVDDDTESDSSGQYPPSSGKGILINDDGEPFGVMDNDSSSQTSRRDCVENVATWLRIQNAQNVCMHEWGTVGGITDVTGERCILLHT